MATNAVQSLDDATMLHNGVTMPWAGLGTWRAGGDEAEQAVTAALELGYKHIDTAAMYQNEEGIGRAIRNGPTAREDLFVTTKIWNDDIRAGQAATVQALDQCLSRLGFEYVDLVLLHWPADNFSEAYQGLEQAYQAGKTRAIGVSNFMVDHLQSLLRTATVTPMVNQVEFHPYLVQPELLEFCREQNIQHEAWSPLMQGHVTEEPEITRIAQAHGKTPAQVVLRWDVQRGTVTIPKSVKRHRIEENSQIFDFQLSENDMATLDRLDQGKRFGPDPNNFSF